MNKDFNFTEEDLKAGEEQEQRCLPVARKIVEIIATTPNLAMGSNIKDEDRLACYEPMYAKIVDSMLENNVRLRDIGLIFSMVRQPLTFIEDIVRMSLDNNKKVAEAFLWGFPGETDTDKLSVSDIQKVLLNEDLIKSLSKKSDQEEVVEPTETPEGDDDASESNKESEE